MRIFNQELSREEILRRVGDLRQLAGAQAIELVDGNQRGVRAVRMWNAAGLDFTVLTDRGMSIGGLAVRGAPIAYASAAGAVHPAYQEDRPIGWLRAWPGGFLTTCGLTQVGSPCEDGGQQLGLHGRAASLPAREVGWGQEWRGENYEIWVQGAIQETSTFGENLLLKRRIAINLTEPRLWIEDTVENLGFESTPHMFLQHINLGYPLVDASSHLTLPACQTNPRDEDARSGLECCCEFQPPTQSYREQVFYHENPAIGKDGVVEVRLANPSFHGGLTMALRYKPAEYPLLVEWKMMGEGLYVVGLEPANCHVEGRVSERERGTLQILQPGEIRRYHLEFSFLSD